MAKLGFNQVLRFALAAVSVTLIGGLAIAWWQRSRTEHLTLAAGASSGESYILGNALKTVVERHYPKIRMTLLETGGTVENLSMLQDGRAQLATAQADIPAGLKARSVAVLYDDTFQLLVPKQSQSKSLVDLEGKRIALAQSGGQFQSFLHVADHFGLHEADFQFVGTSDEDASAAFLNGRADALFRVRAIDDPSIQRLVQSGKAGFLPLEHAAAMKIKYPAFEAALIPIGDLLGKPSDSGAGFSNRRGTPHAAGSRRLECGSHKGHHGSSHRAQTGDHAGDPRQYDGGAPAPGADAQARATIRTRTPAASWSTQLL
jgi:uncharacterized protein